MDKDKEKSIHEFSQISSNMQEWDKYLHLAVKIKRAKGQELFESGEIWNKLYLLQAGEVKLIRLSNDGKEKILWRGIAPCLLGEGPFFDGLPTLSFFVITKPSVLYSFSAETVYSVLLKDPLIVTSILRNLSQKVRLNINQNCCLSFSELSSRICMYLYQKMHISENRKQFYAVPELTQQDLANHLSVHRVTLNKKLRFLEQQGIIGPYNRKLTYILDVDSFLNLIQS